MKPALSIIVPVFNAAAQLERMLVALQRTLPGSESASVILIDDASTDARVGDLMARYATHWTVITQPQNLGFVATANHGMRAAGNDDVVLLNSDTIPAGHWVEHFIRCAASDARIASITPWSNNGEIVSLPELCRRAPIPDRPERWAAACAAGQPTYPELPTAVGFCMYLRRRCLHEIGDFDEQTFGRGYGEENDWSMRAAASGWKNVLCDTAFVAHEGNASFAPLGLAPDAHSMRRLLDKHPGYLDRVQRFIRTDPLAEARRRIMRRLPHRDRQQQ